MGKSTLVTHLLKTLKKRFDLVISFQGATACSPELKRLIETRWDTRFVFNKWNQPLMDAVLDQQERLKKEHTSRQICVLVDDIILTSKDEDALSHLCLRGRHFNISVICAGVSYTTLPKRCRRSLDVLFLYSCPMAGDCKLLCSEYAERSKLAKYLLTQLPEHTCLVMETLTRRQRLYHYKVLLSTRSEASQDLFEEKTTDESDSEQKNPSPRHLQDTLVSEDCIPDDQENETIAEEVETKPSRSSVVL